jgi:peptidoglycan/LPS O-acetylase OafA/YrhL
MELTVIKKDKENVSAQKSRELIALTSLRGVAALWVAVFHFITPINRDVACISCYFPILEKSYLAVDLFFVLSGYILTFVYKDKATLIDLSGYVKFMRARLARIYPLHFVCLFAFLVVASLPVLLIDSASFNPRNNPETFFYNLLLIHAWGTYNDFSWNNPSWSISTEFFAYLTFPLMLALLTKNKLLIKTIILVSICLILLYPFMGGDIGTGKELLRCLIGFYLGVTGYLVFNTIKLSHIKTSVAQITIIAFILFSLNSSLNDSFTVLLWLPLIYSLSSDSGVIAVALQNKFLYFLGTISYSIYLIHAIILMAYRNIRVFVFDAPINLGLLSEGLLLIGLITITIALSYCTYIYIESRWRRILNPSKSITK